MKALGKSPLPPCILRGVGYLALALVLCGSAVWRSLEATGGEPTPPLDDTYIHLQYARATAGGTPFTYQPGSGPSRGGTSLLYPFLLAPFVPVTSPGGLVVVAWAFGALSMAGAACAADRFASRRGTGAGPAAALLFLLSGHAVWGAASGMEIGLMSLALSGALAAYASWIDAPDARRAARRLAALAAWLLGLGLVRPEGILLGGVLALAALAPGSRYGSRAARLAVLAGPAAALLVTLAADVAALGEAAPNVLSVKAAWAEERPDERARILARLPWVFGRLTATLFGDFGSRAFGGGSAFVLRGLLAGGAVLGAARLFPRRRGKPAAAAAPSPAPERALVAVLFAGLLAGLVPADWDTHHHRYQIPLLPAAMLLVAGGVWRLPRAALRAGATAALLVLLLPGTIHMIEIFMLNSGNIHDQQVAAAQWIDAHLPADAVVAVNDAGALAYLGNRRIVDLVGLVTPDAARPGRAGPASRFEWLEGLPPGRRPTHFAIFPDWYPYLRRTSLVGRQLARFHLVRNTISGADLKAVYAADWRRAGVGDRPAARAALLDAWGFRIEDRLDVAELGSMAAHDYVAFDTWRQTLREFSVDGRPDLTVIDGGLQPTRGERFRMRCRPGAPAALVMRTEAFLGFTLRVRVNGHEAGAWTVERRPGVWTEPLFEIPAALLDGDRAEFELALPEGAPPYPVFGYWLLQ